MKSDHKLRLNSKLNILKIHAQILVEHMMQHNGPSAGDLDAESPKSKNKINNRKNLLVKK